MENIADMNWIMYGEKMEMRKGMIIYYEIDDFSNNADSPNVEVS